MLSGDSTWTSTRTLEGTLYLCKRRGGCGKIRRNDCNPEFEHEKIVLVFWIAAILAASAFSAAPKKPLSFAAELKKIQAAVWESEIDKQEKVFVKFQKGTLAVSMKDEDGKTVAVVVESSPMEKDGERIIVNKKTKSKLLSYELDGKELTVTFSDDLQSDFDRNGKKLPRVVSLKSGGNR